MSRKKTEAGGDLPEPQKQALAAARAKVKTLKSEAAEAKAFCDRAQARVRDARLDLEQAENLHGKALNSLRAATMELQKLGEIALVETSARYTGATSFMRVAVVRRTASSVFTVDLGDDPALVDNVRWVHERSGFPLPAGVFAPFKRDRFSTKTLRLHTRESEEFAEAMKSAER